MQGRRWKTSLAIAALWLAAPVAIADGPPVSVAPRLVLLHPPDVKDAPVVTAVRIQPGGRLMVSAGDDHQIRLWDLTTGRLVRRIAGHLDWVGVAEFSPNGDLLATAGHDGQIILWDVETGERLRSFPHVEGAITAIVFSGDGRRLACAAFGHSAELFDVATARLIRSLACPCRDTRCVAFSPDDQRLAVAGRNGIVRIWNLAEDLSPLDWKAHEQRIRSIGFAGDGQILLSAGEDGSVRGWGAQDGRPVWVLPKLGAKIMALRVLQNGWVAVAGSDNRISLWDIDRLAAVGSLEGHTGSVVALDARDGLLASGSFDTSIRVWALDGSPLSLRPAASLPTTRGVVGRRERLPAVPINEE
jgi:WD40 repeat protein